jgi:hypothetical protein
MLETPSILCYSPFWTEYFVRGGSENVGVRTISREVVPSPNLAEALTPQRLHAELLATSASGTWSYLASRRDFVSRVGSWHPRKRGLLAARFGHVQRPG